MTGFKLKQGMLLGTASAATQIEGGDLPHSWNDWSDRGKIKDSSTPRNADEHWRLWREDAALMQVMGLEIYRMGIEWARVEPEEGHFDETVIKRYLDEIDLLLRYKIKPLVTLHHFTNPMWFERKGAFEKTENLRYFLRFAEKMVRAFGERVCEYITLNEPNVYAMLGYFTGEWPPGGRNFFRMNKVVSVMATGHIRTYEMIHRVRLEMGLRDTKVGFAHHMRAFAPASSDRWLDRRLARLAETIFQDSLSFAALRGEFKWPLRNLGRIAPGIYADFHGLNYYTRSTICAFKDQVKKDAPVNDLGWEIYPDGLIETASRLHDILSADIYVTENGTCDNEDRFRCRYLYEHLKAISESTLPFRRYYHWCFCDNFEWVEGVSARFGIVHVDYDTQRRSIKRSGRFFSGIIERQGVDGQLYEMFVAPEAYGRLV